MTPQETKTLKMLIKRRKKGITPLDFPTGFRLGAYIFDLRAKGHDIATVKSGFGKLARYILMSSHRKEDWCN